MNSDAIFSMVVILGIAALVALYYKTFIADRVTPAHKSAAYKTSFNLVQRLNRSDATEKNRLLP